jgi:predicted protein tyrosine phosphatase
MDNSDNYPVLIHCYHGTGRAEMYSLWVSKVY